MRFRLQSLIFLTTIAAVYSTVAVVVGHRALWDGMDLFQGVPNPFAILGAGGSIWLVAKTCYLSGFCAGRLGKPRLVLSSPWNRWLHSLPATAAMLITAFSLSQSMRFPLWFLAPLLAMHLLVELSAETVVREKGIVCKGTIYPFNQFHFWVKQDVHTAYLMRRVPGERPRRRLCRVFLRDAEELQATLDSVQPPAEPGDELFVKEGPFDPIN